ncbi:MAG: hypothetical protein P4L79_09860 [Legionella sp.]|uniref:hypothetical protein n=1 Tax=Legionella sp. TaxID=459 RepID=UPI002840B576|nr:hypothetical protein [Legionella sp.]
MASRSDLITSTSKQLELYSDITRNLDVNPMTKQLARLVNEAELKDTVANLILIDQYEVPYYPLVGSQIQKLLFEIVDNITATTLTNLIQQTIVNNASDRVNLVSVVVNAFPDQDSYDVTVTFTAKNSTKNIVFQTILARVR